MKTILVTLALVLAAKTGFAQVCGDVDDTGKVTAGDALRVLKTAVGIDVPLICDTGDCLALETRMDALEDETVIALDGDGNVFGRVVSDGEGGTSKSIFLKSLGKVIRLRYANDEASSGVPPIQSKRDRNFFFPEPNCQGTPFITTSRESSDENYIVAGPDGRSFVSDGEKTPPLHMESLIFADSTTCVANVSDLSDEGSSDQVIFNLREITLPFSLPAPGPFQVKSMR